MQIFCSHSVGFLFTLLMVSLLWRIDYHKSSSHPSPYKVIAILLIIFSMLYLFIITYLMYFTSGSMQNLIPIATPYTNFVSRIYIWIERRVHFPTEHLTYIHCPLLISLNSVLWFLLSICQPEHLVSAIWISPYGDWYVGIIFIFNDKAKYFPFHS